MPCSVSVSSRCGRTGALHERPPSLETATISSRACAESPRLTVQSAAKPPPRKGTTDGTSAVSAVRRASRTAVCGAPQTWFSRGAKRKLGTPPGSRSIQLKTTRSARRVSRGAELPAAVGGSVDRPFEHATAAEMASSAKHRSMRRPHQAALKIRRELRRFDSGARFRRVVIGVRVELVDDRADRVVVLDDPRGFRPVERPIQLGDRDVRDDPDDGADDQELDQAVPGFARPAALRLGGRVDVGVHLDAPIVRISCGEPKKRSFDWFESYSSRGPLLWNETM